MVDFGMWLDRVSEIVEPVQDADSLGVAIQELKKLESKTQVVGAEADKLFEAVSDDPEAKSELYGFMQEGMKTRFGAKLKAIQDNLKENLSESQARELREVIGHMFNRATGDDVN